MLWQHELWWDHIITTTNFKTYVLSIYVRGIFENEIKISKNNSII